MQNKPGAKHTIAPTLWLYEYNNDYSYVSYNTILYVCIQ